MADQARLVELLERILHGSHSPEEVGCDCPELPSEVRNRLQRLKALGDELRELLAQPAAGAQESNLDEGVAPAATALAAALELAEAARTYLEKMQRGLPPVESQAANGASAKAARRPITAPPRPAKRRPRALALAVAAVVLFVLAGAGAAGWAVQKKTQTDTEIRAELIAAQELLDQGWDNNDLAQIADAQTQGTQVASKAQSPWASSDLRDKTASFRVKAQDRLARAEKNQRLRTDLLDVVPANRTDDHPIHETDRLADRPQTSEDAQFAAAFKHWGVDIHGAAEADVIAQLKSQPKAVVREAIEALDRWMLALREVKAFDEKWNKLFRVAQALDTSANGQYLRRIMAGETTIRAETVAAMLGGRPSLAALWELTHAQGLRGVVSLLEQNASTREPSHVVTQLARLSDTYGDHSGAENLLRQALVEHPGDVMLLHALAHVLENQFRHAEAIEFYRLARAFNSDLGVRLALALGTEGRYKEEETLLAQLLRQQPKNADLHLHMGDALAGMQMWRDAELSYRTAIDLKPDFVNAHVELGAVLHQLNRPDQALAAFRKATEVGSHDAWAFYNLGMFLHDLGKPNEALNAYLKAVELSPHNAGRIEYFIGAILYNLGKLDKAMAAYRAAVALNPNSALAHRDLGYVLEDMKLLDHAVGEYRTAVGLAPADAEAQAHLGNVLNQLKRPAEAASAFQKAIALKPDDPALYRGLGKALHDSKKLDEAVVAFRRATELQPNDAAAYHGLGAVLAEQKRLEEAVSAYLKALQLHPDDPSLHRGLGTVLYDQKRLDLAEAAFRKAIELKPDDAEAYHNLGIALRDAKKFDDALAAYQKAIELKPKDSFVHQGMGNVLYDLKKLDEAAAAYRKATDLDPTNAEAYHNLGMVLRELRQFDKALAAFRKAVELQPNFAYAHLGLGNVLYDQKNFEEALAAYRKAIELKPNDAGAYDKLGDVLRELKQTSEAVKAYHNAVALKAEGHFVHSYVSSAPLNRVASFGAISGGSHPQIQNAAHFATAQHPGTHHHR